MKNYIKTAFTLILTFTITYLQAQDIHKAANEGDLDKVRELLEADSTLLESRDKRGNTPLICACSVHPTLIPHENVANYLIEKGADVNAKNKIGVTPIYFAIKNFNLVKKLIEKGADIHVKAYGGQTPIFMAGIHSNTKVVKLLIEHGAEVNNKAICGTIIHKIVGQNGDPEILKLLVDNGAKFTPINNGNTELHIAAINGYKELSKALVNLGLDVNTVNDYNHSPLYYAAKHGHRSTAETLISLGADTASIDETNYGKAKQLSAKISDGEAYLWSLATTSSPMTSTVIKTKNHLLIIDPINIDETEGKMLASGHLNLNELEGQNIIMFFTREAWDTPDIYEISKQLPKAEIISSFKPTTDSLKNEQTSPCIIANPNESHSLKGVKVHTIAALPRPWMSGVFFNGTGLGYLIEVDELRILHVGHHAPYGDDKEVRNNYRKEIDYLKQFGSVDIVILPVQGRHLGINYSQYLYLIDNLSPKSIYLLPDDMRTGEHLKCAEELKKRKIQVDYPEGGMAIGQRFHYIQNKILK